MSEADTPEAAAWELFKAIRQVEEKADQNRSNLPPRTRLLDLYAECLAAANGKRTVAPEARLH